MVDEALHRGRIGGSQISAIFGENDFLDEYGLYLALTEERLPPQPGNERMALGKFLEQPLALRVFPMMTGHKVEWCDRTERSEQYEFMVYTPDALVLDENAGIDCKVIFPDRAWKWGWTVEEIPAHAILQAYWYMIATGRRRWYIMALVAGEPRLYVVDWDEEFAQAILKKAQWWWRRHILENHPPPVTASPAMDRWLKHRFPRPRKNSVVRATDEEAALLDHYRTVRAIQLRHTKERMDLEAAIKAAIGEREGLYWDGGRFTWKRTKDSTETDWKALAEALLMNHQERSTLIKEFTSPKPGFRRMYFRTQEGEEEEL